MELEGIAARLAATAADLPLDRRDASRRFTRVHSTASYDAWVIRWQPSAELDLHDHGGSQGIVHVVDGALVERHTDLCDPGIVELRTIRAGSAVTIGETSVHGIANLGPIEALSVHVYSPPLSSMTFYDHDGGCLTPSRTDRSTALDAVIAP